MLLALDRKRENIFESATTGSRSWFATRVITILKYIGVNFAASSCSSWRLQS